MTFLAFKRSNGKRQMSVGGIFENRGTPIMKTIALIFAGILGIAPAFGEGEVGSQAFSFAGLSDLAPSPTTYGLAQYDGKVRMLVVFQYNCGGCVANAPKFGRLVDTLERGADSAKFQAIGAEISTANYSQIQNYRNSLTNSNTLTLNFPLVKVPNDTNISSDGVGTKWRRYNSYRDVYFVINHSGQITARIEGNRQNAMTTVKYDSLRMALNAALAAVPAALASGGPSAGSFRVERAGQGFYFRMNDAFSGTIALRISDLQGRVVRSLVITPSAPEAVWNGLDASGGALPYGMYFLQATGAGLSLRQRIPLLP
jgi:hypothetical protein